MIVVDASAVVDLLLRAPASPAIEAHILADDASLHAPELIDAEVLGALRRKERRGDLGSDRAKDALADLRDLPIHLYPVRPLLERAWDLRANLTAADALYAALAEALGATVLTTDAPLARALERHTDVAAITG